jgi:D-beta-D-heptose 7-phosphate kinase/D-beta-D-heptose 1-phosphate adenosyltransferase
VFTNGCFDILHAGHVTYLEQARAQGDRLIVAVNDDASVSRLKGPGRPINSVDRRMAVLAGLGAVDWVISFAEGTPEQLLAEVCPDVLVKGGDYSVEQVVGADIVNAYGGTVKVLGLVENSSTTAIVEKIRNR